MTLEHFRLTGKCKKKKLSTGYGIAIVPISNTIRYRKRIHPSKFVHSALKLASNTTNRKTLEKYGRKPDTKINQKENTHK